MLKDLCRMSSPTISGLPMQAPAQHRRSFASFRTIIALVLREMSTSYGRSPGGYLWAVLEPVAGIALLSAVFSIAFTKPALGVNFPLFYATGMVPFLIFTSISNKIAQALNFSRPLLAYPSVTFIDAIVARFLLNMLTEIMVCYIVFTGILLIFDTRVIVNVPVVALGLLMAGFLALGVGTLNCFLFTKFPLWQQAWSILMRPMFIISCVIMVYDRLPDSVSYWLWFNPVVHVIGMVRHGVYSSYVGTYISVSYVFGFSAVCMVFGLIFLRRYQYSMFER